MKVTVSFLCISLPTLRLSRIYRYLKKNHNVNLYLEKSYIFALILRQLQTIYKMYINKLSILVITLAWSTYLFGQNNIQNLFFNSADNITRLDFSTTPPIATPTNIAGTFESIAHYEDDNGNLLFLVNANGVYDKNNNLMPNSGGISINTDATEINICPVPNNADQYYILYNGAACSPLSYTLVDMSLNAGLGDVIAVNTPLDMGGFGEGMEVVAIPNQNAYWYLTYECTVGIKRFLIDENGIQAGEIIYNNVFPTGYDGRGEFDYHNGKLGIAFAFTNKVLAAEFDPVTGNVCNAKVLEDNNFKLSGPAADPSPYGLEFSPDGTKMYFSLWYLETAPFLYQYDFDTDTYTGYQPALDPSSLGTGHIELGSDGKLYIIQLNAMSILVIDNPNEAVPTFNTIPLQFPTTLGISDHIQSSVLDNFTLTTTNLCVPINEDFTLIPDNNFLFYDWIQEGNVLLTDNILVGFMETTPITYTAQSIDNGGCVTTIEEFNVYPIPDISAGNDLNLVVGESATLTGNTSLNDVTTIWFPPTNLDNALSLTPTIIPTETGVFTYVLSIATNTCQVVDTVVVTVTEEPISIAYDTLCVAVNESITLLADTLENVSWALADNSTVVVSTDNILSITVQNTSVTYHLTGTNPATGHTTKKEITIHPIPLLDAGENQTIQEGQSITLNATNGGSGGYIWSPTAGLDNPLIANPIASPASTTTYYVTSYFDNNCLTVDSVTIIVEEEIEPIDTTIVTPPINNESGHIVLPTAFSPNEDGVNDKLQLQQKDMEDLLSFRIFNRWGQVVFETTDWQAYWDGFYRSRPQETGVYIYHIIAINKNKATVEQKGSVLLLR